MSIERRFDVPFVSSLALREKAIQQNYRPVIAVHKWFARRPGSLFRSLLLSEFVDGPLRDTYFRSHQLRGKHVADPFMGGGTPLLEANRLGARVSGWDINPMACWIVGRELDRLDPAAYSEAGHALVEELRREVGDLYETECTGCGASAPVKYFLWVKTQPCQTCDRTVDLFPNYRLAANARHPRHVFVCPGCGELNESDQRAPDCGCFRCGTALQADGPARRGVATCKHCGGASKFPSTGGRPLPHRMFAIEYHCAACAVGRRGRFFKKPSRQDLARCAQARKRLKRISSEYVPDDAIPLGDESTRLHRWGYKRYRQMFNARQLLGLEASCNLIAREPDEALHKAFATNLSDLLRYNNLLVRYDPVSLKALDIFSVHGFPTGLVRCEVNLLGIRGPRGKPLGSGGWANVIDKYRAAKEYCTAPFEVAPGSRTRIYTTGEQIGARLGAGNSADHARKADLRCGSATDVSMPQQSLDAVFTDPPYYDSVQYAELMDFCYVWLRRLARGGGEGFHRASTRSPAELTGNRTAGRTIEHFAEGLADIYSHMAKALKPGAPLVFTYHHNQPWAYRPVAMAVLDAGLAVTAALPCPAEMSGSIHINGTRSSIVDTVFVCRAEGSNTQIRQADSSESLARLVATDLAGLRAGGVKPTTGDARCVTLGHLTRLAVRRLRPDWATDGQTPAKLEAIARAMEEIASLDDVVAQAQVMQTPILAGQRELFKERHEERPVVAV